MHCHYIYKMYYYKACHIKYDNDGAHYHFKQVLVHVVVFSRVQQLLLFDSNKHV